MTAWACKDKAGLCQAVCIETSLGLNVLLLTLL